MARKAYVAVLILFGIFAGQRASATDCGEFVVSGTGCKYERWLPWVAYGGPWSTNIKMGNVKLDPAKRSGQVIAGFELRAPDGQGKIDAMVSGNRPPGINISISAAYFLLNAGESIDMNLLYPASSCTQFSCQPDTRPGSEATVTGSLLLSYSADDPAYLRGLAAAQVVFMSKDQLGGFHWQAVEQEGLPAKAWRFPMHETYAKSANWQSAVSTSLAVQNPGDAQVTVDVKLADQNNTQVVQKSIVLGPKATVGLVLWQFFGDSMFPGGKDFYGWASVEAGSPSNGQVTMVAFQTVGDSMGNIHAQPLVGP